MKNKDIDFFSSALETDDLKLFENTLDKIKFIQLDREIYLYLRTKIDKSTTISADNKPLFLNALDKDMNLCLLVDKNLNPVGRVAPSLMKKNMGYNNEDRILRYRNTRAKFFKMNSL